MRQLTGTEAGTLSGLLFYGTYVLDFRLNGTLCAKITRPECRRFKCMERTHLSWDQSCKNPGSEVALLQGNLEKITNFRKFLKKCAFVGARNQN